MPRVLLQQGNVGLLYIFPNMESSGAVVAGTGNDILHGLEGLVEHVIRVGELRNPLSTGTVEDDGLSGGRQVYCVMGNGISMPYLAATSTILFTSG